ncbi:MAG: tetratricopeptide repeat protein [Pyrinomonadaceae bacterium]
MFRLSRKFRIGCLLLGLLALPVFTFGQDLGSSTDLLKKSPSKKSGGSKKATPRKSRTTSGKKSGSARTTPSRKKSTARNKKTTPENSAEAEVSEPTPQKIVDIRPQKTMIITVGEKSPGDYNEFFEKAIEEGNNERNIRNYPGAETAYLRAQSLRPEDFRAIYGLGNLYSDQQRWEEAENAYRGAIKLDPDSPEAYIALSFVLTQPLLGTNLLERYAEAERLARRAIELDANNAVAHDQLGVALELQGNISDQTKTEYEKAVQLDPTFALAHAHLGRLLRRKGLTAESNQAYVNSIKFSVDVPTMILVADVMQSQQRYLDSEQLLRRALREDPKNPTALYLLGRALTTRGSFEEAEQVLKKSAEVSPKSFVSYTLLGSLFLRQGNFQNAENYLGEALKIVTANEKKRLANDFEAVGDGYLEAGKKAEAIRVYQKALGLDETKVGLNEKINKARAN